MSSLPQCPEREELMTKHTQPKPAFGDRIEANDKPSAAQMQEPTSEATWAVQQIVEPESKR